MPSCAGRASAPAPSSASSRRAADDASAPELREGRRAARAHRYRKRPSVSRSVTSSAVCPSPGLAACQRANSRTASTNSISGRPVGIGSGRAVGCLRRRMASCAQALRDVEGIVLRQHRDGIIRPACRRRPKAARSASAQKMLSNIASAVAASMTFEPGSSLAATAWLRMMCQAETVDGRRRQLVEALRRRDQRLALLVRQPVRQHRRQHLRNLARQQARRSCRGSAARAPPPRAR